MRWPSMMEERQSQNVMALRWGGGKGGGRGGGRQDDGVGWMDDRTGTTGMKRVVICRAAYASRVLWLGIDWGDWRDWAIGRLGDWAGEGGQLIGRPR